MPTLQQWAKASEYHKNGKRNLRFAKNSLDLAEKDSEKKEFYIGHFLAYIDIVLFWANEVKDELR